MKSFAWENLSTCLPEYAVYVYVFRKLGRERERICGNALHVHDLNLCMLHLLFKAE